MRFSMVDDSGKNLCLYHILDGLREGLSRFSGQSRTAIIYGECPDDPIRVYDPQDLLQGHEPKIKEIYLDSDEWRVNSPNTQDISISGQIIPEKNLELSGLISYGGRTRSIFYQMWFTEHHPDMCSIGPTERWLEHAVYLLSLAITFEDSFYATTSGHALREYASYAVRDYILDEVNLMFGWDAKIFVFPILEAILGISKTPEEGMWPHGKLVFISPDDLSEVTFLARFPKIGRPRIENYKHVRKLLQAVEHSDRKLVSFGKRIIGIATGKMPDRRTTADFSGEYGFLRLSGSPVCSFSDGSVYSTTRRANLVHLEEALLEYPIDPAIRHELFQIVTSIVNEAGIRNHGCTLVIDLNDRPVEISGQKLEYPMNLEKTHHLALAKSLAKVDGALQVGTDRHLHRFACLLDGRAVPGEDRARGARFNSALRFTADQENLIVVVVSSDRPVSIIAGGVELSARCEWKPFSKLVASPSTLEEWLNR